MKSIPAMSKELVQRREVMVNCSSSLKAVDNSRAYVGTATHCWSIAQGCCSFLDRSRNFLFPYCRLFGSLSANSSKGASANKGSRPGAKVFCAKPLAHHLFDVFIDMPPLDIDEFIVPVQVLEDL